MQKNKNTRDAPPEEKFVDDPVLIAFNDFDKNDDGKITNQEFRYILTHVGENLLTNEEVDSLFKECGLQDDGELNYEEFVQYWRTQIEGNQS